MMQQMPGGPLGPGGMGKMIIIFGGIKLPFLVPHAQEDKESSTGKKAEETKGKKNRRGKKKRNKKAKSKCKKGKKKN